MPPSTRSSSASKASQKATPAPAKAAGGAKRRKSDAKEDEGKEATKPKKRKTSGKKGKEKAEEVVEAGRDVFSSLPMDLVLQICSDVDPGTLLAISQTSKSIRSTLIRKAAEPVWLAARRNFGMPDLQAEVDEPMYAYLVQGKACQICGTTRLKTEAEHELRVRACSKCMTANLRNASRIRKEMDDLHPLALEWCLSTPYSAAGNTRADEEHYFWVPEVAAVSDHLHAIDPPPKPEKEDDAQPEYSPNDDTELFREECRQRKVKVSADAATIFKYESRSLDENLAEERKKINDRFKQIQDKLIAAGFEQSTLATPTWARLSGRPLTEQEWVEIGPAVTATVRAYRDTYMRYEADLRKTGRRNALRTLRQQVFASCTPLEQQLFPRDAAFYRLPTVEPLWEPEGVVANPASWSAIVPSIRLEVQRQMRHDRVWCADQLARVLHKSRIPLPDAVLRAISQESSPFVDEKDETKGLAPLHAQVTDAEVDKLFARPVSIFMCSEYCGLYPFTDAIKHLSMVHGYFHTNASCLPAPASYLQLVDDMLERANLDRADTTMEDLASLGNRFTVELRTGKTLRDQPWKVVAAGYYTSPLRHYWSWHRRAVERYDLVKLATSISLQPPPPPPQQLGKQAFQAGAGGGRRAS
ncbi:hypothetical protein NBRC10513v2_003706 [Rhodotorula toruloides]